MHLRPAQISFYIVIEAGDGQGLRWCSGLDPELEVVRAALAAAHLLGLNENNVLANGRIELT